MVVKNHAESFPSQASGHLGFVLTEVRAVIMFVSTKVKLHKSQ